jgi:hypothetical protein
MARARVHRNIEMRQQWAGLEIVDGLVILLVAGLLMFFNGRALGWNALIVVSAYVGLRVAKRGRPEGWLTAMLRFHARRAFYSAAAPDAEGRRHPFPQAVRASSPGPRTRSATSHKE